MKNYFFCSLILLLTVNFSASLSAQKKKDKYEALNTYFETIVKDTTQTIYVAKEKISSNETLTIFESNVKMINDPVNNCKAYTKLFNWRDFEKMKKKYKNTCTPSERVWWCSNAFWETNDFKYKKVLLESMNTVKNQEYLTYKYHGRVYAFSEPIYYQNKKYLVFTAEALFMSGARITIVIMEKVKSKWTVMSEWSNPYLYN